MLNSNVIKKFVLGRKNSLLENIVLCFAITLTSAFIWFDSYYFFMDILRAVASVMLMFAWLWCGFLSGKDKKWGFLIFATSYWLVPYLYMTYYSSRDNIKDYNAFLRVLYKFSDLLFDKPLKTIAEFTHCGVYIWILSLVIMTFTAYFVGINVADIYKDKKRSDGDPDSDDSDNSDDSDDSDDFEDEDDLSYEED